MSDLKSNMQKSMFEEETLEGRQLVSEYDRECLLLRKIIDTEIRKVVQSSSNFILFDIGLRVRPFMKGRP